VHHAKYGADNGKIHGNHITGVHSVKWIQKLQTTEWVAITADNSMKASIMNDKDVKMR
jgi:hypothetical protein